MLCCFIANQYADHSNNGNYGVHLLGAGDVQLPGNLEKSTAFDMLHDFKTDFKTEKSQRTSEPTDKIQLLLQRGSVGFSSSSMYLCQS